MEVNEAINRAIDIIEDDYKPLCEFESEEEVYVAFSDYIITIRSENQSLIVVATKGSIIFADESIY